MKLRHISIALEKKPHRKMLRKNLECDKVIPPQ